jgi:hypothetical protein
MAQSTKRAVRAAAGRFNQLTNDELRERVKEPLTESEFAALERVFAQRGMKMPAEHGEVSEDPTPGTRVISLEELNDQDFGLDKRKTGMGWPEVVAVIVGMVTSVLFSKLSFLTSVLLGLAIAMIVYGILIFARKFWREMGFKSGKIEGTELPRRGKNRSR